ncbi:MAG: hypothetical protein HY050_04525 [Actinobacteria bacterium]|nr:hypothetical protein [Actinomycetota bacterium]
MWDLITAGQMLLAIMPPGVKAAISPDPKLQTDLTLHVSEQRLRARFVKHANLAEVKAALSVTPKPRVLLLPYATPAIRHLLAEHSVGWVDETGSAQIASGPLLISCEKTQVQVPKRPARWTRSMLGVAEALLIGTPGTVASIVATTGLAPSSAASALRILSEMNLLSSDAARGRLSRRRIVKLSELLSSYSEATILRPNRFEMHVGVLWQDPLSALAEAGEFWTKDGRTWAATSAIAAAVMAPFGTQISPLEIYMDATSPATMTAALRTVGLYPLKGGRLVVAPFPSEATRNLVRLEGSIQVVPWPRAYADLQHSGVRGEDVADHLREVMENDDTK